MTRKEIIGGLQMTIDLFLFDPRTGEVRKKHMLNDTDRTTVDACEGAIQLLEAEEHTNYSDGVKNGCIATLTHIKHAAEIAIKEVEGTK